MLIFDHVLKGFCISLQVSSEIFSDLDDYMWKLLHKWAKHSHPKKSRWWIIDHYFGRFNKSRNNRWVFGDLTTGAYLPKFAWTKIIRHTMVIGTASPDDPNLVRYWTDRRRKQPPPPLNALVLGLLKTQKCRCVLCGDLLLHADKQPQSPHDWEQWLRTTRMAIRKQHLATEIGRRNDQRLIHASCQRRIIGKAHQHS